jgi:hypothetical protein
MFAYKIEESEPMPEPEAWEYGYLYVLSAEGDYVGEGAARTKFITIAASLTAEGYQQVPDWTRGKLDLLNRFGSQGWIINNWTAGGRDMAHWELVKLVEAFRPDAKGASVTISDWTYMRRHL